MAKLKACPFCGGPGVYRRANASWVKHPNWTAGCEHGHATSPDMESKKEAADWWNRRPKRRSATADMQRDAVLEEAATMAEHATINVSMHWDGPDDPPGRRAIDHRDVIAAAIRAMKVSPV
ncbi:Lar family restriction alleviation protein [Neorhizobium sp. T786]|uniref:Lar family restriction alleviation protein n=1 Tax=Pseudorhizobium xiangyangii TaxID=2883104 RepID=UPI001CFF96FF|nr:Lar family restriction alleviation protein [Neorhizobium xiangyangii]MCB5201661.1 Lar family restriction alleviation protein [Neorhizobium xiangyangii]